MDNAFAVESRQFITSDIISFVNIGIQSIKLQKTDVNNSLIQISEIEEKSQIDRFVNELLNKDIKSMESQQPEQKICLTFDITAGDYLYRYVHGEGFFITDTISNKTITLRYLLPDECVKKIIEDESLQWSCAEEDSVIQHEPNTFCEFRIGNSEFKLNNEIKQIDENKSVVPFLDNDNSRTMVPLRCLSEGLDYDVTWIPETKQIILEKSGLSITVQIASTSAMVKQYSIISPKRDKELWGKEFCLETAPVIVNDRAFVPLRFVAELFNYDVKWDEQRQTISINPKAEEQYLHTYPIIEFSDNEIKVGLKTYNLACVPKVMRFNDGCQLIVKIYDSNENDILSLGNGTTLAVTERIIRPETEDVIAIGFSRSKLKNGVYYLEACYANHENNIYRTFFCLK